MTTPTRNLGRRPSMSDVGRLAEVSAQTVSRYYTGGYVSPDTRERIEKAITRLGYRHNRLPRNLRAARTDSIGFLGFGPVNGGHAAVLAGVSRAALAEGQTLLTTLVDLDPAGRSTPAETARAIDNLIAMRIDALIVASPFEGVENVLRHVGGVIPVISMSEVDSRPGGSFHADSYGAARLAVEHLVALGHQRILHLAGPEGRIEAAARIQGYLDVLAENALTPLPLARCAEWDAPSGAAIAEAVDYDAFSAVFAANDEIALGFMSAARRRGFTAPADYSIVGIDDMPDSQFLTPPLTSVRIDFLSVGESALRLALANVRGYPDAVSGKAGATLSIRESAVVHQEPARLRR